MSKVTFFLEYISNMQHFLDEFGNIPKEMPKQVRELGSFFTLVIDTTTKINPSTLTSTDIRCFESGCLGTIRSEFIVKVTNQSLFYPVVHFTPELIVHYSPEYS